MRWLLAAGSAAAAIGIYVGLAVPLPFSGSGEMAMNVTNDTLISAPISTAPNGSTAVDSAPAAPSVTPTEATPVSRSSGS